MSGRSISGLSEPTIMFIIFSDLFMFEQIFLSPQVKRSVIIKDKLVYLSSLTTWRTISDEGSQENLKIS